MSKMIGFPERTTYVAAGAWIASKTRKLPDGRFEGVAALFASDPAADHKGGIRCNQVFAIALSRGTAERHATRALESCSNLRRALSAGEVSYTHA